jgi:hypothetical protein
MYLVGELVIRRASCLYFFLPESPPSEINFGLFSIARKTHSCSQEIRTLTVVLGLDRRWACIVILSVKLTGLGVAEVGPDICFSND